MKRFDLLGLEHLVFACKNYYDVGEGLYGTLLYPLARSPYMTVTGKINSVVVFLTGRGIPDVLARENNRARQIHPSFVPSLDDARASYELNGGNLSAPANFGSDPLSGHQELILQRELFMQNNNPSPENIFAHVVNGSNTSFAHALQTMIDLTNHLSTQI